MEQYGFQKNIFLYLISGNFGETQQMIDVIKFLKLFTEID